MSVKVTPKTPAISAGNPADSPKSLIKFTDASAPILKSVLKLLNIRAPPAPTGKKLSKQDYANAMLNNARYFEVFGKVPTDLINIETTRNYDTAINITAQVDNKRLSLCADNLYPCNQCCNPVTYAKDDTGNGLACDACDMWFHNSCAPERFRLDDDLLRAIENCTKSNNLLVHCPSCMYKNSPITLSGMFKELKLLKKESAKEKDTLQTQMKELLATSAELYKQAKKAQEETAKEKEYLQLQLQEMFKQLEVSNIGMTEMKKQVDFLMSTREQDKAEAEKTDEKRQVLFSELISSNKEVKTSIVKEKQETRKEMASLGVKMTQQGLNRNDAAFTPSGPNGVTVYDPRKTVLIQGVKDRSLLNGAGANLRRQLSKVFQGKFRFTIDTAQKTIRGALQYQLRTAEEAKQVIEHWDASYFGGETTARSPMLVKKAEAVIRDVPVEFTDELLAGLMCDDITTAGLVSDDAGDNGQKVKEVTCTRMIKAGKPLYTIKVELKTEEQLNYFVEHGLYLADSNHHLLIYKYIPSQAARVIRCNNCQGYGHVKKTCTKVKICMRCGVTGHEHWPERDIRCQNPANCVHCKTDHEASSPNCLKFLKIKDILVTKAKIQPRFNMLSK